MEFRIADTFQSSLGKLNAQEQKSVKTTAFDLQMNLSGNSTQFHKIERAKDPNFWSVRANSDIRLIVHKTAASILLCYVDFDDDFVLSTLIPAHFSNLSINKAVFKLLAANALIIRRSSFLK